MSAGYDDSILEWRQRLVFVAQLVAGVVLVSILIGLITDAVQGGGGDKGWVGVVRMTGKK